MLILPGEKRSYEIRTRSVCCAGPADRDASPRSRFRIVASTASLEKGRYRIGILCRGARTQALWLREQSLELR